LSFVFDLSEHRLTKGLRDAEYLEMFRQYDEGTEVMRCL